VAARSVARRNPPRANEEICRELGLAEPTLKKLIAAILKALKEFGRG